MNFINLLKTIKVESTFILVKVYYISRFIILFTTIFTNIENII